MCGIVGIASVNASSQRDRIVVQRDVMTHRGPDDAGIWFSSDGRVGLAHRRLAIIDLSPAGQQPMLDHRKRVCITFNGEIYNYRELRRDLQERGHSLWSATDTEVILEAYHEWGTDCLHRLNGMFAFALYDIEERLLFVARDRSGEKPLYYRCEPGRLSFASELKSLLADPEVPRKLDLEALTFYLTFGYVPGHRCILQGFKKLPPAHAATFEIETGHFHCWRYWELPAGSNGNAGQPVDGEQLATELGYLLEASVRQQMVADVPVGVLLSGGIDSSLVTAMAAKNTRHLKTFTISFPDYGPYDETVRAKLIADHFATEHVELVAEPSTIDLLPVLARQFDEPVADSSIIPTYLVSSLVRRHCTVALGGDGGDELFGGYQHYSRLLQLERLIKYVPYMARSLIASGARKFLPLGCRGRNWLLASAADLTQEVPHIARLFDSRDRARLLHPALLCHVPQGDSPENFWQALWNSSSDLLDRAMRADYMAYLPEDILVKLDRASMMTSLEVRAPMLDYRIIEFAFGKVPSQFKTLHDRRKILLKILGQRILPPEFDWDRKQGFSIPLADWLRKEWKSAFLNVLFGEDSPVFKRAAIKSLWDGHQRGRSNSERIFAIAMFELWRREYRVSL